MSRNFFIFLVGLGINPKRMLNAVRGTFYYVANLFRLMRSDRHSWPVRIAPVLSDRFESAGSAEGHYFHMDLWAARKVYRGNFANLVDVGSRIDGYIAHILTFRSIEVIDIRQLMSTDPALTFRQADLTDPLSVPESYADCVSCLHALEHFGLGRYGDRFDLNGWLHGLKSLIKMLKPGGTLLLAVPIGRQRIDFDAHRVFDPVGLIREAAEFGLSLREFSYVGDDKKFRGAVNVNEIPVLDYGCGCFEFVLSGD